MSSNSNDEDINNDNDVWHTVAPRNNRARRTATVTPDTTPTPVRYPFRTVLREAAALFNDEPIPVTIEEDIELDDDMTPPLPTAGTLAASVGAGYLTPDREPTTTSLTAFQKHVANHLAQVPSRLTQGGFAWLIEDEDLHKLRIGIVAGATFAMQQMPTMPKYESTFDATAFKHFDIATSFYVASVFWNSEILSILDRKFPSALSGLEVLPGVLPSSLTAREAIEHIRTKVVSESATTRDYASLLRLHLAEKYVPDAAGPVEYLKTCRTYQQQVKDLGLASVISDDHLMSLAVTAFDNSGHNPSLIARVHRDYTEQCKVVVNVNGKSVTNGSTGYEFFAKFYTKQLRLLYEEGDRGTQRQQAHLTEALQSRIIQLESQMEAHGANIDQVNDNVHEMHTANSAAAAAKSDNRSAGTIPRECPQSQRMPWRRW